MHNEHTIMTKLAKLRVHIVPLGFEIDRILLPAKEMKADKIWLVRHDNPSQDKAKSYSETILKDLKKNKIQVEFAEADRGDVFNILKIVKEIFEKEKEFEVLGLVEKTKIPGTTKPEYIINLKKDYQWFLSDEFKSL